MSATSFFTHRPTPTTGTSVTALIRRAVTISRQAGCGAQEIAGKLAAHLQAHGSHNGAPWTIFDHSLMEKVVADSRLPIFLATHLPEERKPAIKEILDEIFAGEPPATTEVRHAAETLLGLAEVGNVILIGGGGHIVAAKVPHVLHVRLVAPLEHRLRRAQDIYGMSPKEAHEFCISGDADCGRFIQDRYQADINDALRYHLVINTALMSFDATAKQIEEALWGLETMPKSGDDWSGWEEIKDFKV